MMAERDTKRRAVAPPKRPYAALFSKSPMPRALLVAAAAALVVLALYEFVEPGFPI